MANREIFKLTEDKDLGREVWAKFDDSAEVYELFASDDGSDYIGCADTKAEALSVAREHFADLRSY